MLALAAGFRLGEDGSDGRPGVERHDLQVEPRPLHIGHDGPVAVPDLGVRALDLLLVGRADHLRADAQRPQQAEVVPHGHGSPTRDVGLRVRYQILDRTERITPVRRGRIAVRYGDFTALRLHAKRCGKQRDGCQKQNSLHTESIYCPYVPLQRPCRPDAAPDSPGPHARRRPGRGLSGDKYSKNPCGVKSSVPAGPRRAKKRSVREITPGRSFRCGTRALRATPAVPRRGTARRPPSGSSSHRYRLRRSCPRPASRRCVPTERTPPTPRPDVPADRR